MRRIWLLSLIALMGITLMVTVTQAALLTLESSHTITPTVYKTSGTPGYLTPTSGSIKAGVNGNAVNDPSESPGYNRDSQTLTIGTNNSATATLGTNTWLQQTDASVTYTGATNVFTTSQTYLGSAPNPSTPGGTDGYLEQYGDIATPRPTAYIPTYFKFTYTLAAGQNYSVNLADAYSYLYQLDQSAGSTNLYYVTHGYLGLYAKISYPGGTYTAQQDIVASDGSDDRGPLYPIPNFELGTDSGAANLGFTITSAPAGTLTFEGYLIAEDYGQSYNFVPLPATWLLLGSGLVGLGLLGRRKWSQKK